MGRIRYTSDLHLNHPYVAKLRGFPHADAHDEVIIENFNKGIRDDDLTFIAGDVAMRWNGVEEKIRRLRGRKILIEGNHDIMSSVHPDGWKYQARWIGDGLFEAIVAFKSRKAAGRKFLISHYPYKGEGNRDITERYTQFRLKDEGLWLLHGHTHSKDKHGEPSIAITGSLGGTGNQKTVRYRQEIHIGVDAWDLRPVHEEEVLELITQLENTRWLHHIDMITEPPVHTVTVANAGERCRPCAVCQTVVDTGQVAELDVSHVPAPEIRQSHPSGERCAGGGCGCACRPGVLRSLRAGRGSSRS